MVLLRNKSCSRYKTSCIFEALSLIILAVISITASQPGQPWRIRRAMIRKNSVLDQYPVFKMTRVVSYLVGFRSLDKQPFE
jgi:hypothetical protein